MRKPPALRIAGPRIKQCNYWLRISSGIRYVLLLGKIYFMRISTLKGPNPNPNSNPNPNINPNPNSNHNPNPRPNPNPNTN